MNSPVSPSTDVNRRSFLQDADLYSIPFAG